MKLAVPVVNRTNYSKLKPIIHRLREDGRVDVSATLSSGILIKATGETMNDIIADGVNIASKIDCLLMNDSLETMAKTVGISMLEHASVLSKDCPDAMLTVGDRFDMIAPVVTARILNIPILHIQGGERSGSVDDTVRDIITVCSTRHYVATEAAKKRVYDITKSADVMNFGCPAVELVSQLPIGDNLDVRNFHKRYRDSIDLSSGENYIVVLVHPDTTREDDVNMHLLLDIVLSFNMKCAVLYPNIDAFRRHISNAIRDHHDRMICIKHMPIEDFVPLMAHARCMVGNSSSGIREAATFGTPVVNVGKRQNYRDRNKNTIDVAGNDSDGLSEAIEKSLSIGRYPKDNIYYKPNCCENICNDILSFLEGL